ncbi:MAG TPA: WD40 repeat domain-containing protein, partial [Planctomycetota bacterium]|nr:WD40 repeat domain-containing protein [Planctomycetota bacterium]
RHYENLRINRSYENIPTTGAVLNREGTKALIGATDDTLGSWDFYDIAAPRIFPEHVPVTVVAADPDHAFAVTTGKDGAVRLWDAARGTEIDRIDLASVDAATAVGLSRDGRRLVAGTAHGLVLVYDVPLATGK